ncbi:MAG TPA: sensor histidine kinase, partial [Opitutus sp.]|nr:sensor histidine kinase [Opitutus sp.]
AGVVVAADAARLRQAVDNLVDNALKFTPAGKGVQVTVRSWDGGCVIEVADEGPGLAPEDFAHLFQPFRPLTQQPTGGESSSGLGLHLTREIIALHGGRVEASSAPGSGAVFRIWLPRGDVDAAADAV